MDYIVTKLSHNAHVYTILSELAPGAESYFCIGVQEGECLRHVLESNIDIQHIALCDTWGPHHGGTNRGSHDHIIDLLLRLKWHGRADYYDGDSKVVVPTIKDTFDLTYVDGDHSEEMAYLDMTNTWPLTKWVMVVHDIAFDSVAKALERFKAEHTFSRTERSTDGTHTEVLWKPIQAR